MITHAPRLLLTNDDGVDARGLLQLNQSLSEHYQVDVVAPAQNWSGASHALTLKQPLYVRKHSNGFISTTGTPVDSVHIGLTRLLAEKPDLVVSGINHGANLGDDVLYSGTVAAAMEGRFVNKISLAISLASFSPVHFETAGYIAKRMVDQIFMMPDIGQVVLNVNVPDCELSELKGIKVTRLGRRACPDSVQTLTDPKGNTVYWIGSPGEVEDDSEGTDFHAVKEGFVSVTPVSIDKTASQTISLLNNFFIL